MRKRCPSDVSKEAFEEIRPLLESMRKQTKLRAADLYEVFCGVLYLLKSGCQWGGCRVNFQNGGQCIAISPSGASLVQMG